MEKGLKSISVSTVPFSGGSAMAPKGAVASVTTSPVPHIGSIKFHCNIYKAAGRMYDWLYGDVVGIAAKTLLMTI